MKILTSTFTLMIGLMICRASSMVESERYRLDDPELAPFSSMYQISREKHCLTEIDRDAEVEIERDNYATKGYHVMLHLYSGNVSRTVAFEKKDDEYIWVGEQENHRSGRKFETVDGEGYERISITYTEKRIGSYEGFVILYSGDYRNVDFSGPFDLTCEEVTPYIEEWDRQRSAWD